jgi:hypothetical protein
MTLASANIFPKVTFVEGAAPSSPSANDFHLYFDSSDHLLKWKNSAGAVTTIATGSPLTDPMTTRGDIIVRNSSNVTARLAIGSSGKVLQSDGTDISWQTPAAAGALTQIAQTVLSGTATNITFSSIAGTYSSLMLIFTGRTDRVNTIDYLDMQFNTDTGANYNFTAWDSVPTTAGGTTGQTALRASPIAGANAVANKPGSARILIPDYARTVFHKTVLSEGYKPDSQIATKNAGDWNSTAAITAVKLIPAVGPNFITGTVATLYGIS